MKILALSFANLNSLEGRWEIDFTRPEYRSDGIFAITGPTGSGKSTILDALCLALYGQTPRLGKITKGGNEIMSRHAGDCFAEATFSTVKGTFRCNWSQHRARRRAGGELQAQKHELSDAVTGQLLQTRLQETLAAVEEITGMDFERFTRSMLLAQGGFAAFLQADADRRAPVLEQITGTEVYSRISMRVHERQRDERAKLELLRAETGSLRLLSDEEVAMRDARLASLVGEESATASQLDEVSASLRRFGEIDLLAGELTSIYGQLDELKRELGEFEPDAGRLRLSRIAGCLENGHAALDHQREELLREASDLEDRQLRHPALANSARRDAQRYEEGSATLQKAVDAEARQQPLHEQVISLDRSIADMQRENGRCEQELLAATAAVERLDAERSALAFVQEDRRGEQAALDARLVASAADAALASELSGIRNAFDELKAARERRHAASTAFEVAKAALDSCRATKSERDHAAIGANEALADAGESLHSLRKELSFLLDGNSLKHVRQELELARQRRKLLDEVAGLYASGTELALRIGRVTGEIGELEQRRSCTVERLAHAHELLVRAETEADLLKENQRLAALVKSFEDERIRLAEGKPCPLCGSTAHPYVSGGSAVPSAEELRLREARESVRQHAEAVRQLEIAVAEIAAGIEQRTLWRSELDRDRESHGRKCITLLRDAGIREAPRDALPEVLGAQSDAARATGSLEQLVETAEALEERIRDSESQRQLLLEALAAAELRQAQAVERLGAAEADHLRQGEAFEAAERELASRELALKQLLQPFALPLDSGSDPAPLIATLMSRSERRLADEKRKRLLESELNASDAAISGFDLRLESMRQDLEARRHGMQSVATELEKLTAKRRELFGDQDPAAEAGRLAETVMKAREAVDTLRDALARSRQELGILETAVDGLGKSVGRRREAIAALESAFLEEIRAKGFADEQAFIDARLPEAELRRLEALSEGYQRREQELMTRREDRASRLKELHEAVAGSRAPQQLAIAAGQLQDTVRTLREEIGAIRQQLAENERISRELRQVAAAVDTQASECLRWDRMHELIGSADGKKFRNFAQGLTFEIMVAHANRQLSSMTDRYLLVRDASLPLELNVVDTWQAGEVRSTRNLSGGESFIVSLALALGLSQMSSRNVRVDSLFLDEGFGTLDEEALETALETLAGLQQSGKLIGIISHVSALKERISTRIRVTPLTGGRSALSGPGVARR
ncbi:MAG: AAA family ATPase [Chlorobiaceae bacterium]|nr:AAA family ATPase [Chlorobiaceae bacterium]